jgi:hypothetical protein
LLQLGPIRLYSGQPQREREAAMSPGDGHSDASAGSVEMLITAEAKKTVDLVITAVPFGGNGCCENFYRFAWPFSRMNLLGVERSCAKVARSF